MLSDAEITIFTRWDDSFGDRRFHAFVRTPDGDWLHEGLLSGGLARVRARGAALPDATGGDLQKRKLEELEREARR